MNQSKFDAFLENLRSRIFEHGAQFVPFGIFGIINYMIPYFMWPQATEPSHLLMFLRVIASVLCLLLILHDQWPPKYRPYLPLYWYATLLYCLPFLTTYLLLSNEGSTEWLMNMVLAVFLLVLLVDWASFLILLILGIALGTGFFVFLNNVNSLTSHDNLPLAIYMYLFAIMIGLIFSRNKERWLIERLNTMKALSGAIAHEMRTPLTTIGYSVRTLTGALPKLLTLYRRNEKTPEETIEPRDVRSLDGLPERLYQTSRKAQSVIDMLLTKLRESHEEKLTTLSARQAVQNALEAYPFNDREKEKVHFLAKEDFNFKVVPDLFNHVLFNLIKNALFHVKAANKGEIEIWLESGEEGNKIHFKDTGPGIPAGQLPYIFDRFYSKSQHGTGIGLAFCKQMIKSFRGNITCDSVHKEYTTFTIIFPPAIQETLEPTAGIG